jgi:flagellar motor switch protein FliG
MDATQEQAARAQTLPHGKAPLDQNHSISKMQSAAQLTPTERVAVLLMSIGVDAAAQIFRSLSDAEMEEVTNTITETASVPERVRQEVLAEFTQQMRTPGGAMGGLDVARNLVSKSLAPDKANEFLKGLDATQNRSEYFNFLMGIETSKVVATLQLEHPQTVALVLAYLPAPRASEIFGALPANLQVEVSERLAAMAPVSSAIVKRIEQALQKQFVNVSQGKQRAISGVKLVVGLLNKTGPEISKKVLDGLNDRNPKLAEEVRKMLLIFEDLQKLPDMSIQAILREVDMSVMALALKGGSPEIKDLFLRNMSKRAAERLLEEMDLLGPKPKSEVNEARDQVVAIARKLEEEGKISLNSGEGGGDELVE